ncbi:MAG: hypothetical protein HY819_04970 [Acidobacteria bacterium]|nr:hypothetical protein [Acidobacteriota bacterium]
MTQKLTVKNESLPKRCEICHQADYLEPNNNICLRCQDINIPLTLSKFNPYKEDDREGFFFSFNRTGATRVVAGLLALLFSVDIIGLAGSGFLLGAIFLVSGLLGIQKLTITEINTQFILRFIFNLFLIGSGLSCSYFSGLHLLKMAAIR